MNAPDRIDVLAVLDVRAELGVKQSAKNANAGFVDWRDWCAFLARADQARAAVAELLATQRRLIEAFGLREAPGNGHRTGRLIEGPHQLAVITDAAAVIARASGGA